MATEGKPRAGRSLAKDFHRLMKNIASFSGGQARLASWDETDLKKGITVAIVPDSGLYKDGEFMFEISCNTGYPDSAPSVRCKTPIFHPNVNCIDGDEEVCLNIFADDWSPSMTLEDVVEGILFLIHNPNLEDAWLIFWFTDEDEFENNVKRSLDGGLVEGYHFERNRVTRGEDGEIVKDRNNPEDGAAVCREEQPPKTMGDKEEVRLAGAATENKTTDERKKIGSGEKRQGEKTVIDMG